MRSMKSESLISRHRRSCGLHLGLDLLDDVAFLDNVVLDLDAVISSNAFASVRDSIQRRQRFTRRR